MDTVRTNKLRAELIRQKLLRGVPPKSKMREIVAYMSDQELIRRDDEATAHRIALITERRKKQDPVGKIIA